MKTKAYFRALEDQVGVDWIKEMKDMNKSIMSWQIIAIIAIGFHIYNAFN